MNRRNETTRYIAFNTHHSYAHFHTDSHRYPIDAFSSVDDAINGWKVVIRQVLVLVVGPVLNYKETQRIEWWNIHKEKKTDEYRYFFVVVWNSEKKHIICFFSFYTKKKTIIVSLLCKLLQLNVCSDHNNFFLLIHHRIQLNICKTDVEIGSFIRFADWFVFDSHLQCTWNDANTKQFFAFHGNTHTSEMPY